MADYSLKSKMDQSALTPNSPERRQRNRMLLAVLLLLVAVGVILFKDKNSPLSDEQTSPAPTALVPHYSTSHRGGSPTQDQSGTADSVSQPSPQAETSRPSNLQAAAGPPASNLATKQRVARATTLGNHRSSEVLNSGLPASGPAFTATRTVLPPLRIEVVAGDRPTPVKPGNPSLNVDMLPGSPARSATDPASASSETATADSAPLTSASERVQLSTDTNQVLTHNVRPEYPLLARQMKVQGSVVLDALIGRDGGIQDLQVVQGPTILAEAAREAVRQWRFKPYLQDGRAVETQAHITVNFMISTN
jgi:TonB family protein